MGIPWRLRLRSWFLENLDVTVLKNEARLARGLEDAKPVISELVHHVHRDKN